MNLYKRVKNLLLAGKNQTTIANQLNISRKTVARIKANIIDRRKKWNKKKYILDDYYPFIMSCILKNLNISEIHSKLIDLRIKCSYSTVARFVTLIQRHNRYRTVGPGMEAFISFIPIGKFSIENNKVRTWIFIMRLTYSKYSFYKVVPDNNFYTFLRCHIKAFRFFKGMPYSVKINFTPAFDINEVTLKKKYAGFLNQFGIFLISRNKKCCSFKCTSLERSFKEQFLSQIVHRDYIRLSKELNNWYKSEINLSIHPVTGKVVAREFELNELPNMIPFK